MILVSQFGILTPWGNHSIYQPHFPIIDMVNSVVQFYMWHYVCLIYFSPLVLIIFVLNCCFCLYFISSWYSFNSNIVWSVSLWLELLVRISWLPEIGNAWSCNVVDCNWGAKLVGWKPWGFLFVLLVPHGLLMMLLPDLWANQLAICMSHNHCPSLDRNSGWSLLLYIKCDILRALLDQWFLLSRKL